MNVSTKSTAGTRLRALLGRAGLSQSAAARLAGYASQSGIQTLLESTGEAFHPSAVTKLRKALVGRGDPKITDADVLALSEPAGLRSHPDEFHLAKNSTAEVTGSLEVPRLPLYGSAMGGPEGIITFADGPIDWVSCPPELAHVKNAFAVWIVGDSMSPRFEPGWIAYVNPHRPAVAGNDVLLIRKEEDGTEHAMVKTLVATTPTSWRVRQYNPRKEFDLPRKTWQRVLWIGQRGPGSPT